MRRNSGGSSAKWIGRGAQPTPTTTMHKAASRSGASRKLHWKTSRNYEKTRRMKATKERKLAAHRKSLHGQKVHEIVAVGNTIFLEKLSYKAWQNSTGKSVGLRAPGMFVALLRRTVASTGGTLHEVPTRSTKLSQYCHGAGSWSKNPSRSGFTSVAVASGRCNGICIRRFWPPTLIQDTQTSLMPSTTGIGKVRRRACGQHGRKETNGRKRGNVPRSFGIPRARVRLPRSLNEATPEPAFLLTRGRLEAWKHRSEPPLLEHGESSVNRN